MLVQSLKHEVIQLEANLCSAFADPTRILILYLLNEGPRNVTEIASELGVAQPTASRHLKVLRDHALVRANRQGTCITYQLADQRLIEALDILRGVLRDTINDKASLIAETESED
jgi:ArsR family transcriptional regulator